ncbi:MAG: hypothetical protein OXF27_01700 [Acidobacteria bacterium]|nr:hypothetical protein [Acidobacteriota bacterium]
MDTARQHRGKAPWWILGCGAGQLLLLAGVSHLDARVATLPFLWLLGGASVAYVATLLLLVRRPHGSRRQLAACLLIAVAGRLLLLGAAPIASDDVYRYLWDGRVQRYASTPSAGAPADPALAGLHTADTRRIDPTSAVLPAIYPPAAQLFLRAVTAIHESVTAVAAAMIVCDLLIMLLLWRWLAAGGRSPWWVLAYAWHPLPAIEGAAAGHIDLLGTLLVVAAAAALHARRTLAASLTLAAAFSVKFLPLVLAPLLWRRVRLRDGLAAVAAVGLLYLPFIGGAVTVPIGSLPQYAAQWRFNGPLFAWIEAAVGAPVAFVLAVGAGLAAAAAARARLPATAPEAWAWPLAATLLLLPTVYPWYLVWMIPFLAAPRAWPLIVWTLAAPLTYIVWTVRASGAGWVLPGWVEPIEYGLLIAALAVAWAVRRRAGESPAA